jgi:hypothetical protein
VFGGVDKVSSGDDVREETGNNYDKKTVQNPEALTSVEVEHHHPN